MRTRIARFLPVVVFVGLAAAFDYLTFAAIAEVGFVGVERLFLSVVALVVGTVGAYTLTRPIVSRIARR